MDRPLARVALALGIVACDPAPRAAELHVDPIVVDGGVQRCPVITGVGSGSLETQVGDAIELEAFASPNSDVAFRWSGGIFEPPDAAATRYLCMVPGEITVSVALSTVLCPDVVQRVALSCTSEACSECLRAASEPDVVSRCAAGDYFDADQTQRCVDALACSLSDADGCAADSDAGVLACYCGARSHEACARQGSKSSGPAGSCVGAWEAATDCQAGDARCVLDRFSDPTRPSGVAERAAALLSTTCAQACGAGWPAL